jgi:hypothetical protein
MERSRDAVALALIAMVSRILKARPHLADGAAAIEQARTDIADRAQGALSMALRQPALADLVARLPITSIASVAVEERRRSRRQKILLALALTGLSTALALTATVLIRRRQRRARPTVPADRALTTAPPRELVAIPIETPSAEPASREVAAAEMVESQEEGERPIATIRTEA